MTRPLTPRVATSLLLLNRSFIDFEEFATCARAWQVETTLLAPGGFRAELLQVVDPGGGFNIAHTRMNNHLRQIGLPPQGMRTFCIPADPGLRMEWRRQLVSGDDLMLFPRGGELDSTLRPGFDMILVSVAKELLARLLSAMLAQPSDLDRAEVFHVGAAAMAPLRDRLLASTSAAAAGRTNGRHAWVFENIVLEIVRSILDAIRRSPPQEVDRVARRVAAKRAAAYIQEHACELPSIAHVCRVAGISDRSLETGFKEVYGVGPKAYLNALRLNGLNRELRAAPPESTLIADVANDWGYWHMGQLAADYRRVFGELPSATLKRHGASR
jgi:AraC family ethanolamine operon transcriptional activator